MNPGLFFHMDYVVFSIITITVLFFLKKVVSLFFFRKYGKEFKCNAVSCFLLIFFTILIGWMATEYKGYLVDYRLRKELLFHAESVASTINPDRVKKLSFSIDDRNNPAFLRIREQMMEYSHFSGGYRGIYSVAEKDGKIVFGPEDYDLADPMASTPGQVYQYPDEEMKMSFKDGQKRTVGPFRDEYGNFVSAYAPVFSKTTGKVLMLIGVDILADEWKASVFHARISTMVRTFIMAFIFFVFFVIVGIREFSGRRDKWFLKHLEAELILLIGTALSLIFGYNVYLITRITNENDNQKLAESRAAIIRQDLFNLRRDFESLSILTDGSRLDKPTFDKAVDIIIQSPIVKGIQYAEYSGNILVPFYTYKDKTHLLEGQGFFTLPEVREAMEKARSSGFSTASIPISVNNGKLVSNLSVIFSPIFSDSENIKGFIISILDFDKLTSSGNFKEKNGSNNFPIELIHLKNNGLTAKISQDAKYFPLFAFGKTFVIKVVLNESGNRFTLMFPGIATTFFVLLLTILFSVFVVFIRNRENFLEIQVKNKTKELAESENDLMTTLYSIGDAVISTDSAGIVRRMNDVAVNLTGFSVTEGVGKNVEDIFRIHNASTGKPIKCPVKEVITRRKSIELANDTTLVSKNGSERQIADSVAPIIDISGRLKGTVLVFHDVTDQYKIKKQLIESNERFILAVDGSRDGIWDWNLRTNELFLSRRWKEMIGCREDEIPNVLDSFERRVHPDDKVRVMKEMDDYINGKGEHYNCEFRFRHKNGSYIWVLAKGEALFDESGKAYRMAGSHTDITEAKLNEQAYINARKDAEHATLAKSEFLANMSHEIRTPLNGIIGFSELLMRSDLDNIQSEYMTSIARSATVLLDIVNDVLDFSKIEAGKMELESENCNLYSLLHESIELVRHRVIDKPIKLGFDIGKNVPEYVITDSLKLRQVVVNLLSNATKFTEKGSIELKASGLESEKPGFAKIRISVSDTGIGIKPDQMNRLFKSFAQADPSTTRKYGGSGLGLVISNKILEIMGSSINVESKYQEGSVFSFDLDVIKGHPVEKIIGSVKVQKSENMFVSRSRYKVLIAEDNEINITLTKSILKEIVPESEILVAVNGLEAVKMYADYQPDIIFMDIQMPKMDGYTATREIRKMEKNLNRHAPVIALTAGVVSDEKAKCIKSGMDDYIIKPVSGSVIADTFRRHITDVTELKSHFDDELLLESIGKDEELFKKLIDAVKEEFPLRLASLKKAVETGNLKEALSMVHALKGSCLSMRFGKLSEISIKLEKMMKENLPTESLMPVICELETEFNFLEKHAKYISNI